MSRFEFGQTAARVEDLLLDLTERRSIERSVDPQRLTGELEMRSQLGPLVRAQDCQADLTHRGRRPTGLTTGSNERSSKLPGAGPPITEEHRAQQTPGVIVAPLGDQTTNGRAHSGFICNDDLAQARSLTSIHRLTQKASEWPMLVRGPAPENVITI